MNANVKKTTEYDIENWMQRMQYATVERFFTYQQKVRWLQRHVSCAKRWWDLILFGKANGLNEGYNAL